MTTYGVNQVSASTGNPLCDKLKRQFAARGVAKTNLNKAPSTSVMMQRVRRGLDPYESTPDPLSEKREESVHTARSASTKKMPSAAASVKPAVKNAPVKAAADTEAKKEKAMSPISAEIRRLRTVYAAAKEEKAKNGMQEVRVARAPFPFAALFTAMIFTVILLAVMFSFVRNYELTNEISVLEAQKATLAQTEGDLTLRLEERDDIRVIEDIAVNKIGMVKNDLVESRFVSVSGGNRVELLNTVDTVTEEDSGWLAGMLSAIGENFARLGEYID